MVSAKGKDRTGHHFFGQRHIRIRCEFLHHCVEGYCPLHPEVEPDAVHVLGVQLNRRGKEIEIQPARVEQMPGVPRMMRAKLGIFVFPSFRSCDKAPFLTNIAGTPHTHKVSLDEVVWVFLMERRRLSEDGQVVGVAAHDLNEAVLAGYQRDIVDPVSIRLAKTKLAPLRQKPLGRGHVMEPVNFVLVSKYIWST